MRFIANDPCSGARPSFDELNVPLGKFWKGAGAAWLAWVVFLGMTADTGAETEMLVSSSEYNRASSLLFQWWGLFEGPDNNDISSYFDRVFSEDVQLTFGELNINGIDHLRDVYASLPLGVASAHHVESIALKHVEENGYELEVHFVYLSRSPGDVLSSSRRRYNHTLEKTADGNFVLRVVRATTLEQLNVSAFRASYTENRARAAITQYLGIIDELGGDYAELSSLMDGDSQVHEVIEESDRRFHDRGDGVLKGTAEIASWLASRKLTFAKVAHRLEDLTINSHEADQVDVRVHVATRAWPHEGEQIDVESSFDLTLRDTGEQFMIIKAIRRAAD
ncbi:MAG: hypothetical protein AAF699_16590 [Pseudomonadota bacterium]